HMEEKREMEYEEIDLMDYVKVIIKRKKLIMAILAVAVVVAGVISLALPKVYKVDTSIEIGIRVAGDSLIEKPEQVIEKIKSDVYGVTVREKLNLSENDFPKIKASNVKDTNLVTISVESDKSEQAKSVLTEINSLIISKHRDRTSKEKELVEKNISADENKIKSMDSDIERINNKIKFVEEEKGNLESKISALQKTLVYRQDPGTQFALFNTKEELSAKKQQIEDLFREITSLNIQKENINTEINSLRASLDNLKFTRVVKDPTVSEKIVSPRPVLNVGIAGVLGLFIGVFVAFGKEWWEKNCTKMAND
ncbi:MAG: Wzz/FepE/Etk N-terminal domain-containing protein, partial [Minisyncoccia bacterium]